MSLPKEFVDAHHHFIDTTCDVYKNFLATIAPDLRYLPGSYAAEVVDDLAKIGVTVAASVHVEAMPDDGAAEAAWVQAFVDDGKAPTVRAIVGSVDLAAADAEARMVALKAAAPAGVVKGVRWMVDCVGRFDGGQTATHVATKRHDGVDYLRGSEGGYDGTAVPEFEAGYAALGTHGLSFDLQCAPAQLVEAAKLAARHPDVPLVIDHLGKPRIVLGPDMLEEGEADSEEEKTINPNLTPDAEELEVWRAGMKAMAAVPHVCVKIGMLGYIVPGWVRTPEREAVVRDLVLETVRMFGPGRCMVESNWWASAAASDSDFLSDAAPSAAELIQKLSTWFADFSDEEREMLFSGTAKKFYRLE